MDLSQFTLVRADRIGTDGCLAIFCSSCVREGGIRLLLKDSVTHQTSVSTITYDYTRDLMTDLHRIRASFRNAMNRSPIEGSPQYGT